jgi:hypothetical protein
MTSGWEHGEHRPAKLLSKRVAPNREAFLPTRSPAQGFAFRPAFSIQMSCPNQAGVVMGRYEQFLVSAAYQHCHLRHGTRARHEDRKQRVGQMVAMIVQS